MSTQLDILCNSGDCWADKFNNFSNTGNQLYIGDTDAAADRNPRAWIPFTVPLARNTVIEQAYLILTGSKTSGTTTSTIKIGCEAADNPSNPTSGADCNGRTLGSYTNNFTLGQYVLNTQYSYQIDNPISEVIQRAGWVSGNVLAVIVDDVNTGDKPHEVFSYEGSATKRAILRLFVSSFIPRAGGML